MKPINNPSFILCLCVLAWIASALLVSAQSADADFQQAVRAYQQSRSAADAEKVIKLALTLDPKPAIPEEAERFMARGQAALETAKEPGDFKDAAAEFEKAALAAPWLGNAYYNLGIVQDKAGDYPAAIRNLKLYLLAAPAASDAKAVENLIYKIEFKQEKATKDKELAAKKAAEEARAEREAAAKKANPEEEFLTKINGARYSYSETVMSGNDTLQIRLLTIDIKGSEAVFGSTVTWSNPEFIRMSSEAMRYRETGRYEIRGREVTYPGEMSTGEKFEWKYVISEDGLTIRVRLGKGEQVYRRER